MWVVFFPSTTGSLTCCCTVVRVSHLEELCFWLFLTTVAPLQQSWFSSYHFYGWVGGSTVAVIAMPLVAILTRNDGLKVRKLYVRPKCSNCLPTSRKPIFSWLEVLALQS